MIFQQYQLECLSHFSYLVGDETTGRAVVVDPQRDIDQYLADAHAAGLTIERVIETHVHADFLSGHLELAAATGAAISFGAGATAEFPIDPLEDRQQLTLGEVTLEVRLTPGHTPESLCLVISEHAGDPEPWGVLTGDTLFIGDVGRPDLLVSAGWTAEDLAGRLFHSLHTKLLTLPDDTRVFPAHGAGSACGKSLSAAVESTIGAERRTNAALAPMTEAEFIAQVTEGQTPSPRYFPFAAAANRHQHELFERSDTPSMTLTDALTHQQAGAVLIDARSPETFASGHVRGSINVGLDGRFAEYTGSVVASDASLIVITDPGRAAEAETRLARIGFDQVIGSVTTIESELADHPEFAARGERLTGGEVLTERDANPDLQFLDVRTPGEVTADPVPGASSLPLTTLTARMSELDPQRRTIVFCAGGYRSSIAASLLRSNGFSDVAEVIGGVTGLRTNRPASLGSS